MEIKGSDFLNNCCRFFKTKIFKTKKRTIIQIFCRCQKLVSDLRINRLDYDKEFSLKTLFMDICQDDDLFVIYRRSHQYAMKCSLKSYIYEYK